MQSIKKNLKTNKMLMDQLKGLELEEDLILELIEKKIVSFKQPINIDIVQEAELTIIELADREKAKEDNQKTVKYRGKTYVFKDTIFIQNDILFNDREDAILLSDALFQSILRCEQEKRNHLWENVIVTGPMSNISNIEMALEELIAKITLPISDNSGYFQATSVRFVKVKDYFPTIREDPRFTSLLGTYILSKVFHSEFLFLGSVSGPKSTHY